MHTLAYADIQTCTATKKKTFYLYQMLNYLFKPIYLLSFQRLIFLNLLIQFFYCITEYFLVPITKYDIERELFSYNGSK